MSEPTIPQGLADALRYANSYTRIEMLLQHFDGSLGWYRALGTEWSVCDNIGAYRQCVASALSRAGANGRVAMMTEAEREALAELPAMLTVYRGCYPLNRNGLSWSLDRTVAERFPFLSRYALHKDGHTPLLLVGRVRRDRCVLKLDRDEAQVIAPRVRVIAYTDLEVPA